MNIGELDAWRLIRLMNEKFAQKKNPDMRRKQPMTAYAMGETKKLAVSFWKTA
jgi:hypothetical protein